SRPPRSLEALGGRGRAGAGHRPLRSLGPREDHRGASRPHARQRGGAGAREVWPGALSAYGVALPRLRSALLPPPLAAISGIPLAVGPAVACSRHYPHRTGTSTTKRPCADTFHDDRPI